MTLVSTLGLGTPADTETRVPEAIEAPREGFVKDDDGPRLFYRVIGHGGETVVVPLAYLLADFAERLAGTGRTVILYDPRSRGRSSQVTDAALLGFQKDVDDLERVRRHFGAPRISVIGFSYLGAVAAVYAIQQPDRVERLVQLGPLAPRANAPYQRAPPEPDAAALEGLARLMKEGVSGASEAYCQAWWRAYLPLYVGADPCEGLTAALLATCVLENERPPAFLRVLGQVFGSLGTWDWREEARGITAPALVVHGTADEVAPLEGGREWAKHMPHARLVPIEGAGHLLWAEQAEAVLEAIEPFLDGGDPGPATS